MNHRFSFLATTFAIALALSTVLASPNTVHAGGSGGPQCGLNSQVISGGGTDIFGFPASEAGIVFTFTSSAAMSTTGMTPSDVNSVTSFTYTVPAGGAEFSITYTSPITESFVLACGVGPSPAASFVLRTITCTVAVFDGNFQPISDAVISKGQTWYISPTPVKDGKGNSWTEVFVGSYNDGFVPTRCVGSKPSGYTGS